MGRYKLTWNLQAPENWNSRECREITSCVSLISFPPNSTCTTEKALKKNECTALFCSLSFALLVRPDAPFSEFGKLHAEPAYQTQKSCSACVGYPKGAQSLQEDSQIFESLQVTGACSVSDCVQLGIIASKLKYYHFKMQTCTEHPP